MESLLFVSAEDDPEPWRAALTGAFPDLAFRVWPDELEPRQGLAFALVWKPPAGLLATLPDLRAVLSLGAGVDHILEDPALPDVPLIRLEDAGMAEQMVEYGVYAALHYHRRMDIYGRRQEAGAWRKDPGVSAADRTVGVLGLGVLGGAVARALVDLGFQVRGWSRRPRSMAGIEMFSGPDDLPAFLGGAEILINLLPLTPSTTGLLDAARLAALPPGACLVNMARGAHVVEADLLAALDSGHLRGAMLDVFETEPLPPENPLWRHEAVIVTPHVAAQTIASAAKAQVIEALARLRRGEPPPGLVDREAGY